MICWCIRCPFSIYSIFSIRCVMSDIILIIHALISRKAAESNENGRVPDQSAMQSGCWRSHNIVDWLQLHMQAYKAHNQLTTYQPLMHTAAIFPTHTLIRSGDVSCITHKRYFLAQKFPLSSFSYVYALPVRSRKQNTVNKWLVICEMCKYSMTHQC